MPTNKHIDLAAQYFDDGDEEDLTTSSSSSTGLNSSYNNLPVEHHQHPFKVLISGGGFAGLVLAYYLLQPSKTSLITQSSSFDCRNLPIEVRILPVCHVIDTG